MVYINMGIAIFLSQVIPVGAFIHPILGLFQSNIKSMNISNAALGSMILILTFSVLYLTAHLFTKHQKFRDRLPENIPGTYFIISGLALYFIFKIALILASTVEGGGAYYAARQLGVFIIYPAYILIGVGIYKVNRTGFVGG